MTTLCVLSVLKKKVTLTEMGDARYYIDIGGFLYSTTYKTLCKSPTLKAILPEHSDEVAPFLDRDPHAFQYVLNFLRNGTVHILGEDKSYIEFLMGEATYFGLRNMEAFLSRIIERRRSDTMTDIVTELKEMKALLKRIGKTNDQGVSQLSR